MKRLCIYIVLTILLTSCSLPLSEEKINRAQWIKDFHDEKYEKILDNYNDGYFPFQYDITITRETAVKEDYKQVSSLTNEQIDSLYTGEKKEDTFSTNRFTYHINGIYNEEDEDAYSKLDTTVQWDDWQYIVTEDIPVYTKNDQFMTNDHEPLALPFLLHTMKNIEYILDESESYDNVLAQTNLSEEEWTDLFAPILPFSYDEYVKGTSVVLFSSSFSPIFHTRAQVINNENNLPIRYTVEQEVSFYMPDNDKTNDLESTYQLLKHRYKE